jgi:hypothetical protein
LRKISVALIFFCGQVLKKTPLWHFEHCKKKNALFFFFTKRKVKQNYFLACLEHFINFCFSNPYKKNAKNYKNILHVFLNFITNL